MVAVTQAILRFGTPTLSIAVLIAALLLFSAGPQLGSLDLGGNGIPEVPVIISGV